MYLAIFEIGLVLAFFHNSWKIFGEKEAERILEEAKAIAEERMNESFPEIPPLQEQPLREEASQSRREAEMT